MQAEVFKCVDSKGLTTYATKPCAGRVVGYDAERTSIIGGGVGYTLSVARGPMGVFSTPGQVNGVSLVFLIDTGASVTTLSSDAGSKLGIAQCVPVGVTNTANGETSFCRVKVSQLGFGEFKFRDLTVQLNPTMRGLSLIGADLLRQLKLQQNGDVLTISRGVAVVDIPPPVREVASVQASPEVVAVKSARSSDCKREEAEVESVQARLRAGYSASESNALHAYLRAAWDGLFACKARLSE